jgi:hypothetical protein
MNNMQNILNSLEPQPKTKVSNKKSKWREIEQLRDKFQLEKDLKSFEDSLEFMLDDF